MPRRGEAGAGDSFALPLAIRPRRGRRLGRHDIRAWSQHSGRDGEEVFRGTPADEEALPREEQGLSDRRGHTRHISTPVRVFKPPLPRSVPAGRKIVGALSPLADTGEDAVDA
jgi:hypothetical protein